MSPQIAQVIPITFFLIIVRTTMLRFNDRTGQEFFTRTEPSSQLPASFRINHLTEVAASVDKPSEAYPSASQSTCHSSY